MRKLTALICLAALMLTLSACQKAESGASGEYYSVKEEESKTVTNYVQIEMDFGGMIVIELYPQTAPVTVENFKKLVSEKFYDGIIFHRVISGFMIQGGDPLGTGTGGSPDNIFGEFASNGFKNELSHTRGVVSMARRGNDNNSASSQFFIVHSDSAFLDGDYAAFGKVLRGMETVDYIAAQPTNAADKPLSEMKIKAMTFVDID